MRQILGFTHTRSISLTILRYIILILSITLWLSWIFSRPNLHQEDMRIWLVDASQSMLVEDIIDSGSNVPLSRINAAKELMLNINKSFPATTAILSYARIPYLNIPFTENNENIRNTIKNIPIITFGGGSDMYSALELVYSLYYKKKGNIHIIMLSDGGNSIAEIKNPHYIPHSQFTIVGIGSTGGGKIPTGYDILGNKSWRESAGNPIISKREDANLTLLAKNSHASLILSDNIDTLRSGVIKALSSSPKPIGETKRDLLLIFASAGILLFYFIPSFSRNHFS